MLSQVEIFDKRLIASFMPSLSRQHDDELIPLQFQRRRLTGSPPHAGYRARDAAPGVGHQAQAQKEVVKRGTVHALVSILLPAAQRSNASLSSAPGRVIIWVLQDER
jgi:hypothetical protein